MPQSKNRQNHKEKVAKRNQKLKQIMTENPANSQDNQQDQVIPIPAWSSKEEFKITGLELDYIYNYLTSVQPALAAATAILNRGIMEGKIKMKWQTQDGKELSAEDAKPHQEQFEAMINAVKTGAQPAQTELSEETLN